MQYAYLSDSVKIKKVSDDGTKGVFNIEGLFPGYGLTLGNSLRRALLSSLPGAAVTQFKVKGVLHEFSTIPGVLEDVVEIGMNLKKLRFKFTADEPQVLTLKVKGEKEVTGADIESSSFVEIVNPEAKLLTITDKKADVEMELTIEKGLGYVPVERRKAGKLEVGVVALDAIFTPVVKVSLDVDNMRVGDRTDYNKLSVSIETDGSITPSEALHKAAHILVDHFQKISEVGEEKAEDKEEEVEKEE
ncbi:MAG: DNA-directed RNA polymerase subunit alpha [Candidatus Colwellbacteria bacterium]|jgi:DNA-directed RNA polymerase subunit alpha|nr:DNA-directed RNA polymerase subunit alpha [Candidatus Colwellbacteria bacterium]MCK9497598.1 DNA-directed RNA polymerase subunit alpha [Candidatus Colwellbacteria bacterium]MDD3752408.1 DNA-directed RNA polymerase subunit alpha [Candidatus Colwellbacteria bacterium]MDD4818809.1 DNA-directed RNA polymerase subunit alpha [Candidatus Colwellbacteria bacterium]